MTIMYPIKILCCACQMKIKGDWLQLSDVTLQRGEGSNPRRYVVLHEGREGLTRYKYSVSVSCTAW